MAPAGWKLGEGT